MKPAVHDLRPFQIASEVALFVHLLPGFSKSKVDYMHMAVEHNNRIMQAFLARGRYMHTLRIAESLASLGKASFLDITLEKEAHC